MKVKHNLQQSESILEEKGYRESEQHYDYDRNTIHLYLKKRPLFIIKGSSYTGGTVTLHFDSSIAGLLEASLTIYCWACLLPELENSIYQQYKRRCKSYVDG